MKIDTVLGGFRLPYRMGISPDRKLAVIVEAEGTQVSVIDLKARKVLGGADVGGGPRGVAISPDSRWAFVTLQPQNEVVVVDLATRKTVARFPVGTAPDGVAYSAR
jgi:YVTN family beta-propeller protein